MRIERPQDRPALPEEHAGVPGDTRLVAQLLGAIVRRFFLEGPQRIGLETVDDLAPVEVRDQVAVLRGGPIHLHPQGDQRPLDPEGLDRQPPGGVAQRGLELDLIHDRVVGRQHDHHVVGRTIDRQGREGDRRRGVAPDRLLDHGHVGQLAADEVAVAPIGDDEDVSGIDQRIEPVDRQLEQRPLAGQRQEGLGPLGSAERPQSGPSAAGEDHGIHCGHSRVRCRCRRARPADLRATLPGESIDGRAPPSRADAARRKGLPAEDP